MAAKPLPALPPHCGSWVIVRKGTLEALLETFSPSTAAKVNQAAYDVLTAADYLGRLNASLRMAA